METIDSVMGMRVGDRYTDFSEMELRDAGCPEYAIQELRSFRNLVKVEKDSVLIRVARRART